MISTVTLTTNQPVDLGDRAMLSFLSPTACKIRSVVALSEYVLANLYFRRTDPPSHVLWCSWKDWSFGQERPWLRAGWVLEVEVMWLGDDPPTNDRVAVLELEEQ